MLGGSGNDKERKMDDKERYTFEVSWEVCNKGGYTALKVFLFGSISDF